MSDSDVISALDAMERLLQSAPVEPETLAAWQQRFEAALATAERGDGWPDIVARAHGLSGQLDSAANILSRQRDGLRKELGLQAQGVRALKGYRPA